MTFDEFIKGQLPILPELQFPSNFLDIVSPAVRQRSELLGRAYSAAFYAHKNRFSYSQKETILLEFNTQCFSVLGQISEVVEFAKGNPAAERHALLKDYQSWINQVEDLLKKAIYAIDSDEWAQQVIAISSSGGALSQIDGRLQLSETMCNMIEKVLEVFDPYICVGNYFPKFNELFHNQAQLEQRIGLALDITVDWVTALVAVSKSNLRSLQKKVKPPPIEAIQAYTLATSTLPKTQEEIAVIMSRMLKRKIDQYQVSRMIKKVKEWYDANGLPIEITKRKPTVIPTDPDVLNMRTRTDGKRTGDPRNRPT